MKDKTTKTPPHQNETRSKALETRNLRSLLQFAIYDDVIEVRRNARKRVIDGEAESTIESLISELLTEALQHPQANLRRRAAELICFVPNVESQFLEQAVNDPSWIVREAAWRSFGAKGDFVNRSTWIAACVKACISDRQSLVREACLQAMCKFSNSEKAEAIKSLMSSLEADRFTHRIRTLKALTQLSDSVDVDMHCFAKLLDDSHLKVRMAAGNTICSLIGNGHCFRFALPQLVKRSFDLDGMAGGPARRAIVEIARQLEPVQPELSRWLFRWTSERDRLVLLGGAELYVALNKLYQIQLVAKPDVHALHEQAKVNRRKWAEDRLRGWKLDMVRSVLNGKVVEPANAIQARFAIKETIWLISNLVKCYVAQAN